MPRVRSLEQNARPKLPSRGRTIFSLKYSKSDSGFTWIILIYIFSPKASPLNIGRNHTDGSELTHLCHDLCVSCPKPITTHTCESLPPNVVTPIVWSKNVKLSSRLGYSLNRPLETWYISLVLGVLDTRSLPTYMALGPRYLAKFGSYMDFSAPFSSVCQSVLLIMQCLICLGAKGELGHLGTRTWASWTKYCI